ncbi:hypothetical protein [Oceanithermus sp.]
MKRLTLILVGLFALAACTTAPITIDLLPILGENASGSEEVTATGNLDLKLPGPNGETVSDYQTIPYKPASVNLDYKLYLSQDGNLQGNAQVTFYLAAPGADLWDSQNQVGEPVSVDMSQPQQTISGTLTLSPAQIDALMAGEIVVGAEISGNVTGSANVSYEFQQLILKVAFF